MCVERHLWQEQLTQDLHAAEAALQNLSATTAVERDRLLHDAEDRELALMLAQFLATFKKLGVMVWSWQRDSKVLSGGGGGCCGEWWW